MTSTPLRHESPGGSPASPGKAGANRRADPAVLRLRAVHRAAADLRRGTPVLLRAAQDLVLLGAETAGARGLAELRHVAEGAPVLLLAPARAAAVLHRPVVPRRPALALRLPEALFEPAFLRGLADPTAEQMLPAEPVLAPEMSRGGAGGAGAGQAGAAAAGGAGRAAARRRRRRAPPSCICRRWRRPTCWPIRTTWRPT